MKTGPLLALAVVLPGVVAAGPFDGDYKLTEDGDCTRIGQDGGALRIADGVFTGVEASCRMSNPVNVIDMDAKLYTMQCTGEDSVWTERAMVMNAADGGIIMVWNGYAFQYDACDRGDSETAAAAAAAD